MGVYFVSKIVCCSPLKYLFALLPLKNSFLPFFLWFRLFTLCQKLFAILPKSTRLLFFHLKIHFCLYSVVPSFFNINDVQNILDKPNSFIAYQGLTQVTFVYNVPSFSFFFLSFMFNSLSICNFSSWLAFAAMLVMLLLHWNVLFHKSQI